MDQAYSPWSLSSIKSICPEMQSYKLFNWVVAFYIAYIVCSIVPNLTPDVVTRVLPIGSLILCLLLYFKECFTNKAFICACLYSLGLFIASQFHVLSGLGYGEGGMDTVLIDLGFTLPPVAMGAALVNKKMILSNLRLFDIVIYASLLVSACYMIPILIVDQSLARRIALVSADGASEEILNFKFGYWNYTMCHIITLFFAPLLGLALTSKTVKRKTMYWLLTALTAYFTLTLTITTTFIYFWIVVFLTLYVSNKKNRLIGFSLIVVAGALIIINIDQILNALLINYEGTAMEAKFYDFQDILNDGTGRHRTINSRLDFQKGAVDGFLNNILVGSSYEGTGGHSILLNRLGTTGLLGFVPFVFMIYFIFIQWYRSIPKLSRRYYLLSWLGALLLLYGKNCFGNAGFCFISIILPTLCHTYSYQMTILPPRRLLISAVRRRNPVSKFS